MLALRGLGTVDCRLNLTCDRSDVVLLFVAIECRLDRAARCVTEHDEQLDAEMIDGVFDTAERHRVGDIAGDADDEEPA